MYSTGNYYIAEKIVDACMRTIKNSNKKAECKCIG